MGCGHSLVVMLSPIKHSLQLSGSHYGLAAPRSELPSVDFVIAFLIYSAMWPVYCGIVQAKSLIYYTVGQCQFSCDGRITSQLEELFSFKRKLSAMSLQTILLNAGAGQLTNPHYILNGLNLVEPRHSFCNFPRIAKYLRKMTQIIFIVAIGMCARNYSELSIGEGTSHLAIEHIPPKFSLFFPLLFDLPRITLRGTQSK